MEGCTDDFSRLCWVENGFLLIASFCSTLSNNILNLTYNSGSDFPWGNSGLSDITSSTNVVAPEHEMFDYVDSPGGSYSESIDSGLDSSLEIGLDKFGFNAKAKDFTPHEYVPGAASKKNRSGKSRGAREKEIGRGRSISIKDSPSAVRASRISKSRSVSPKKRHTSPDKARVVRELFTRKSRLPMFGDLGEDWKATSDRVPDLAMPTRGHRDEKWKATSDPVPALALPMRPARFWKE